MEDDGGERTALFTATLVPPEDVGIDLTAFAVQEIHDACTLPPPSGAGGYLWYREAPVVSPSKHVEDPAGTLRVSMRVQDCADDEWFITYILRKLTVRIPGLCVRVEDEDGEFLLIEAAHELPRWVKPENATNRTWIFQNELHLIPLQYTSNVPHDEELQAYITVADAVALVRNPSVATQVSGNVQKVAFQRMEGYPSTSVAHQHRTLAIVPVNAAKIILCHPQMIAEATHALATRDVVSSRGVDRTTFFPIAPTEGLLPAENVVLIPVKMTQLLYAQLAHDRFFPPKAYGKRWQQAVEQYRLFMSESAKRSSITEEQATFGRWCDTGAKLTAGLELAMASKSRRAVHASTRHDAVADEAFFASLTSLGYFQGAARNSARWNQLAEEARALAGLCEESMEEDAFNSMQALRATMEAPQTCVLEQSSLPLNVAQSRTAEDDEAWLSRPPKELEVMAQSVGDAEDQTMDRLGSFMTKMNEFLRSEGDVEGAMFQDDDFEDGEEQEGDSDSEAMSESERQRRMDALVAPVPISEWGAQHAASPLATPQVESPLLSAQRGSVSVEKAPEPTQRLQGFVSHVHYEGDSDSEGSLPDDEKDPQEERDARRRCLELDDAPLANDDPDMTQEMEGFLDFTRKELGLTDEQYAKILSDRTKRGGTCLSNAVYVPKKSSTPDVSQPAPYDVHAPCSAARPNTKLDSFDTVLEAMENELVRNTNGRTPAPTEMDVDDEALNEEDAELLQHLLASGVSIPESLQRFAENHDVRSTEVNALASFLESFQSQAGHAGPVTNLAGRLGVGALPRDANAPRP